MTDEDSVCFLVTVIHDETSLQLECYSSYRFFSE